MNLRRVRVWDLPIRIFHWTLVLLVVFSFVSGMLGGGLIKWHGWSGLAITGLLVFRILWGLFGSTYARFASFVPTPGRLLAYLGGTWRGLGHNPLGALSVFALLGILIFQASSGLVANDDIAFEGPLYALVSKSTSDWLSSLHRQAFWPIVVLVVLHIGAVLFYVLVKKDNLIKPMLSGMKEVDDPQAQSAKGGGALAFVVAVAFAIAVTWVAAGGLLSPPPPPPVPAW